MQVEFNGRIIDFTELKHGSIFLANLGGRLIVRAVKAFIQDDNGPRHDRLVTIGPFTGDDKEMPGIYYPIVLGDRPVLDFTTLCRFEPSLDPADILLEAPTPRQSRGLAMILKHRVLLCATLFQSGHVWDAVFVDVASGEILINLDHDRLFATRRWFLISSRDGDPPLLDYSAPFGSEP